MKDYETVVRIAKDFQERKPSLRQRLVAFFRKNWEWKYDKDNEAWVLCRETRGVVIEGWFYPYSGTNGVRYRIKEPDSNQILYLYEDNSHLPQQNKR